MALTPPPALTSTNAPVLAIAASYEDLKRTDGWKDFLARVLAQRDKIVSDLLRAPYDRISKAPDADLRAMLYAIDRIIEIPQQIDVAYAAFRRAQSQRERIAERHESLTPNPLDEMFV